MFIPSDSPLSPADFLFPGVHWVLEILLVVFLALFLWICICARSVRYFWKFPAPAAAGRLIGGPQRKRIQPPSMIVDALVLSPGMKILELGCGPGTFTLDIARAVQPDGTVYAVDIQEGMLEQLRSRMKREQVENVIPILADAEVEIPLSDGSMDAAFAVTVLPEIPDPVKALQQVKRLLKDGGCFADAELMIDPDYPLRRTVIKWATKAGFTFRSKSGNAFRYVLVFQSESQ